jgi:hypothetical protein
LWLPGPRTASAGSGATTRRVPKGSAFWGAPGRPYIIQVTFHDALTPSVWLKRATKDRAVAAQRPTVGRLTAPLGQGKASLPAPADVCSFRAAPRPACGRRDPDRFGHSTTANPPIARDTTKDDTMDRTTKILLAAIALGLWANAAASLSGPATAQAPPQGPPRQQQAPPRPQPPPHDADMNDLQRELIDLNRTMLSIAEGRCMNRRLCGF